MFLSDTSVKRPVLAVVLNLLILIFGILAFTRLPLREYPDIDSPVVSVSTTYQGAAAGVVEARITELIEDQVAGIEGIESIASTSEDGRSNVVLEFDTDRNVDDAANDVRDRVSRILAELPEDADPPEVFKVDSSAQVIMWLNLSSTVMNTMELTDYARRQLVDRFSALPGVARVRVGGARDYALRIWLMPAQMAARDITVMDIEDVLRRENLELPVGRVESSDREFTVRLRRPYVVEEDFRQMVLKKGDGDYLVRLGDVAKVEIGPADVRNAFRGNGEPMVGIGVVKQSTANTLAVARAAKAEAKRIEAVLPPGVTLHESYDSSVFIEGAVDQVYLTLGIAVLLVAVVIFLFLGSGRATLIPMITVPLSLVGSCIALWQLDFSINLITLLAMVLSIGLVVDDTIVVVENIMRRIEEGEPPLLAAYRGTREVGFAVIATTLVLVAAFAPLVFLQGQTGRLFVEFALGLSAAVCVSSLVALTLAPALAATLLRPVTPTVLSRAFGSVLDRIRRRYDKLLAVLLNRRVLVLVVSALLVAAGSLLWNKVPREFTPREDRGAFFVRAVAPEGAGMDYMIGQMAIIEQELQPLLDSGEATRVLVRVPGTFGSNASVNSAIAIVLLKHWDERDRSTSSIMNDVRGRLMARTGFRSFMFVRQGLSRGFGQPVQFVIGGSTYQELAAWRDIMKEKVAKFPGLLAVDFDYKETKPQISVVVDADRAADLGVSFRDAGRSLATLFASRRVTTFERDGEEYDIILEARPSEKDTKADLTNVYVRSKSGAMVPLSSLATTHEVADSPELQRFNRRRAITLSANLAEGTSLGEALQFLQNTVREELPLGATYDHKGEAREYMRSSSSLLFVLLVALAIVYLVLAAQFESWLQPLVIMLTVPLAIVGALAGLYLAGDSLNIYSQIGIVMLIGLAAKNGILIVEFANQLRDRGVTFVDAIRQASATRLRPILMTGVSTAIGALPLVLSSGAGAETRLTLGLVILFGVTSATFAAIVVVPAAYRLMARNTGSPGRVAKKMSELEAEQDSPMV